MKSYRKELWFQTPSRRAFINITGDVEQCLAESGIQEGLALVNAMHITASVFIFAGVILVVVGYKYYVRHGLPKLRSDGRLEH